MKRIKVRKYIRKGNKVKAHKRKLPIPKYAKIAAKKGLDLRETLPKSKRFGITPEEARKLKIDSGITRARRIIRNKEMPMWEAKKVARFYQRFKNKTGPRAEGAHLIWGGRKFEREAVRFARNYGSSTEYMTLEEMHAREKWKKQFKPHGRRLTEKEIGRGVQIASIAVPVVLPAPILVPAGEVIARKGNIKINLPETKKQREKILAEL